MESFSKTSAEKEYFLYKKNRIFVQIFKKHREIFKQAYLYKIMKPKEKDSNTTFLPEIYANVWFRQKANYLKLYDISIKSL